MHRILPSWAKPPDPHIALSLMISVGNVFPTACPSGLCTASQTKDPAPVICCPIRLYADDYQILKRISAQAFGGHVPMVTGDVGASRQQDVVIPFGQRLGKELKVEARGSKYSFDWILALVSPSSELKEFVAVEVQTIDTTGSYQRQSWAIQNLHGSPHSRDYPEPSVKSSNFNFENVNKRIIPQLITKGHILRLESLCKKGLFFVCPTPVMDRIMKRLGGDLAEYHPQPGAITSHDYTIDPDSSLDPHPLRFGNSFTTTLDQLYLAFAAPKNMPPKDAYSKVVADAVKQRIG